MFTLSSYYSSVMVLSKALRTTLLTQRVLMSSLSAQDKLDALSQKIMSTTLVSPPSKKWKQKIKQKEKAKETSVKLNQPCIIECKNPELNHYQNQSYDKFDVIPLASKGWNHYKSKGDYFVVNIHPVGYEAISRIDLGSFEDTGLRPEIIDIFQKKGLTTPTEIQKLGIPSLLSGQSSILVAETGCGKTLSFLAPLVQQILAWKASPQYKPDLNAPLGLIVSPGRELVFQIGEVAAWFAELGITYKVISGTDMKRKMNAEKEQVDLVIASLGALSKLTTSGTISTRNVRHVILDEADTLLDDSFNDKMVHYLSRMKFQQKVNSEGEEDLSDGLQLTLVGATMPTSLTEILEEVVDASTLQRIMTSRAHQLLPHVPQKFLRLGPGQKPSELLKIIKRDVKHNIPVIIFSNKTSTCDWISMFLQESGVDSVNLNKAMLIQVREGQLAKYQQGIVNVISCTDVASRGLDTTRARHVINYDIPYYISDYIHRAGRTGRHSPHGLIRGVVTNFVSNNPREIELVQTIEKSVRTMEKTLPNVNANVRRIIHHRYLKKQETQTERQKQKQDGETEKSATETSSEETPDTERYQ
uniref:RNA helicase n=1 Tax=Cacopsylla melanoneura TaxID=428564 RepID=A0A8D9ATM8_9HEMI